MLKGDGQYRKGYVRDRTDEAQKVLYNNLLINVLKIALLAIEI